MLDFEKLQFWWNRDGSILFEEYRSGDFGFSAFIIHYCYSNKLPITSNFTKAVIWRYKRGNYDPQAFCVYFENDYDPIIRLFRENMPDVLPYLNKECIKRQFQQINFGTQNNPWDNLWVRTLRRGQ